jgi:hypothetical protein
MRRRKTNNRLVRLDSVLARTARAVQMLYLTWRLGALITGVLDQIWATLRWLLERRL